MLKYSKQVNIYVLNYSPHRHQSIYLKSNLFFFFFSCLNRLDSFSLYFISDLNSTCSMLLTLSSSYGKCQLGSFSCSQQEYPSALCWSIMTSWQYFSSLLIALHWVHYCSSLPFHVKQTTIHFTLQINY